MRVALVNMPWAAVDVPSLALGILRNCIRDVDGVSTSVHHGHLEYVDWLAPRCSISHEDYDHFTSDAYFFGYGDWIFSSALYDDPHWHVDEFVKHASGVGMGDSPRLTPERLDLALRLHELAPAFVDDLVATILATRPDIVGFTTTFQTSIAALAAARRIKEACPDTRTVFGGANCEDKQGSAMHRNFPFVDYVVRGEGEVVFPELLRRTAADQPLDTLPGLCWRAPDGASKANAIATVPLRTEMLKPPDYDGYYERLESSVAGTWVEPKLIIEGARGCWWGEKHHCTFCGLNGTSMKFRSKDAETFLAEILHLTDRHKILDMFVVDNILDMSYLATLVPRLAESDCDFRFQYEVKANLRREQLAALAGAGIVMLQPGIENLSTEVLRIMRKGVTGPQNIRFLRNSESLGISSVWNYLYGFPGEREEHYRNVMQQIPALWHLPPPAVACRIVIERFSPYFRDPALGFDILRPDSQYARNLALPESELFDLAYVFAGPSRGIGEDLGADLRREVERWNAEYEDCYLTYLDLGDAILLTSRRSEFRWETHSISAAHEIAMFRLLSEPRTPDALATQLARLGLDAWGRADLLRILSAWRDLGVVFEEDGQFIHVATEHENQHLLHIKSLAPRAMEATSR